jgi:hypothetical protein
MPTTLKIYRGSTLIADGSSSVLINGFPLPESAREMTTVLRPRAAQIAVVDFGNVSNSVQLAISREFSTEARAKDHALRAPQVGTGHADLVIVFNDGTDDHTWTLSDIGGDGAAWQQARPVACSGVRAEIEYSVTGGAWSYTGPLPVTYDDGLTEALPSISGGTFTSPPWVRSGGSFALTPTGSWSGGTL